MAIFFYKAKKGPKEIVEGTVEAENRDGAIFKNWKYGLCSSSG